MRQFVGGERHLCLHGTESVKDAAKYGQSITVMSQKSGKIMETDCRHTIRDIAIAVDISLSLVHFHFEAYFEITKDFCQLDTKKRIRTAKHRV